MENTKHGLMTSRRTIELIATYEELHHIPEAERVTFYYGDYGGHFLKHGVSDASVLAACGNALAAIGMSSKEFLQSDDFTYRNGIIARMQSCMLGPDARLRDVLERWPGGEFDCVVHQEDDGCHASVPAFTNLTGAGREDFSALLDARVETVRSGDFGLETVISGVEPQELKRLGDAYDAHEQAEQGMWLM